MPVLVHTGSRVAPGDSLFTSAAHVAPSSEPTTTTTATEEMEEEAETDVLPGEGCVVHYLEVPAAAAGTTATAQEATTRVRRQIVATRQGVAQWDGRLVSVFPATAMVSTAGPVYGAPPSHNQDGTNSTPPLSAGMAAAKSAVTGPRPGDAVHLRVTRLNRLFAFGEIIAVNGRWCSHRSAGTSGISGVFKGVLRQEDIRPFRPTRDQLLPPAPTLAFALGDVVLAEVISQSDAHQYQLSTVGDEYGVVESYVSTSEEQYGGRDKVKLQHISGRRDAMMVASTGAVVPRWCPLLP